MTCGKVGPIRRWHRLDRDRRTLRHGEQDRLRDERLVGDV